MDEDSRGLSWDRCVRCAHTDTVADRLVNTELTVLLEAATYNMWRREPSSPASHTHSSSSVSKQCLLLPNMETRITLKPRNSNLYPLDWDTLHHTFDLLVFICLFIFCCLTAKASR